jgi:hypothetical protein
MNLYNLTFHILTFLALLLKTLVILFIFTFIFTFIFNNKKIVFSGTCVHKGIMQFELVASDESKAKSSAIL